MALESDVTLEWMLGLRRDRSAYLKRLESEVEADGGKLLRSCRRLGLPHRTMLSWMRADPEVLAAVIKGRTISALARNQVRSECVTFAPAKGPKRPR